MAKIQMSSRSLSNKSKREIIVEHADELFYQKGFEQTSFADIANAVKISRGNFYYHFKTKDEILSAVIDRRLAVREQMLDRWDAQSKDPVARIRCFIHILIKNQTKIMLFGCPVGTLSTELAKLNHPADRDANKIFTLFRVWLCRQFEILGHHENADTLAMHLLMRSQGVATMATAFRDENFVKTEVDQMHDWLAKLTLS